MFVRGLVAVFKVHMDPNAPATHQLMAVLTDIWQEYAATHSLEECRALAAQAAENRRIRPRLVVNLKPDK